ncbi:CDP-alcohol phosphatidyltransferase family protein [Streptomonospora arabica]|uniref:CDP-alcohol phosphatidyltransferase family protein n=1 Tax=Streptomonospora arabica TaxID=412417 RepID=A0ABV9STZ3_9ACTN
METRRLGRLLGPRRRLVGARGRAAAQTTALHAVVLYGARDRRGRVRAVACRLPAMTHLGLLEARAGLSAADALTPLRANLPALARGAWTGPLALATDVADGRLARSTGTASPFGAYADALADASLWIAYALRHEPDPRWRGALITAWLLPAAGVTAAAFARGRMVEVPRVRGVHPATVVARGLLRARAGRRGPARAGAGRFAEMSGD